MNKHLRTLLFGFLIWLIPFIISIFFFNQKGELQVNVFLFKSIMIVVGSISAAYLVVNYFKGITSQYLREGIIAGLVWLAVNWLLDIAILIPMSGMSFSDYFIEIGIRYLSIPAFAIAVGAALEQKPG